MRKSTTFALVLGATMLLTNATFAADPDPIADRIAAMKTVGMSLKALVPVWKGANEFVGEDVEALGKTILESFESAQMNFVEGSDMGKTTAKDTIWSDPEGFKMAFANAKKLAGAISAAGADFDEDAFKTAFGGLIKTCKGCHSTYRVPKE